MATQSEIIRLPHDILRFIANFIHANADYGTEWQNLLNANKKNFQHLKRESRVISLSNKFSRLFLLSSAFRETVLSKIEIRSKQLRFSLRDYSTPELDLKLLCPAKHLLLESCTTEINFLLMGIEQIDLCECAIKDLSFCSQSRKVNICFPANQFSLFTTPNATLEFSVIYGRNVDYRIENYGHAFYGVKSVKFTECDFISDVRCFKNAHTAKFISCTSIYDVSSLGNLRELELSGCKLVQDVSSLGKVHKLNISYCPLIEDISGLTGVYDLNIAGHNGSNLSPLKNVKILNISCCYNIASLEPMGRQLEELIMTNCPLIRNVTMLQNVRKLEFSCGSSITNFTGLVCLLHLALVGKKGGEAPDIGAFQGIETLRKLKSLRVENKAGDILKIFSSLLDSGELPLRSLNFSRTDPFPVLSRCTYLKTLILTQCPSVISIPESLAYLQDLTILYGSNVDLCLHNLPALNELSIFYCKNLRRLQISGSEKSNPMVCVRVFGCPILEEVFVSRKIQTFYRSMHRFQILDPEHLIKRIQ
jgi:hypothetical protein